MTQDVARLKALLFESESETLSSLDARVSDVVARINALVSANEQQEALRQDVVRKIEHIYQRAGSEENFRRSVAVVLTHAFHEAEQREHHELANVLAPLMLNTIRTELENNQDQMVQLLYPITGQLVKSYVASEIRKLQDNIHNQIDQNSLSLFLRSKLTGRPVSELAITRDQWLQIEEIFLINRASGELLAHWPHTMQLGNAQIHFSGLLSAINEFAATALSESSGQLQFFRMDETDVHVRASPIYLMAIKCRGVPPNGFDGIFTDAFISTMQRLERLDNTARAEPAIDIQSLRSQELSPIQEIVETQTTEIYEENERSGIASTVMKAMLLMVTTVIVSWFAWHFYTDYEESKVRRLANETTAKLAPLSGYPINFEVGYRGRELTISGLAPNPTVRADLMNNLAANLEGTTLIGRPAVVPSATVDAEPIVRQVRQRLSKFEREVLVRSMQRYYARTIKHLTDSLPEFDRLERLLPAQNKRSKIRRTKASVEKTLGELRKISARLEALQNDATPLTSFEPPFNQALRDIHQAIKDIDGMIGTKSALAAKRLAIPNDVVDSAGDLASLSERLNNSINLLNQTSALIPPPIQPTRTSDEKLRDFIQRNAIFFSSGIDFDNAAQTNATLDRLATLIRAATATVRIVGYTDDRGSNEGNQTLSQRRADTVTAALTRRGVSANRLISIGRTVDLSISRQTGRRSPNRRVQFEIGFDGELREGVRE